MTTTLCLELPWRWSLPAAAIQQVSKAFVRNEAERPKEEGSVSQRNGDRARFDRDRKKKTLHRQRIRELLKTQAPEPKTLKPARAVASQVT